MACCANSRKACRGHNAIRVHPDQGRCSELREASKACCIAEALVVQEVDADDDCVISCALQRQKYAAKGKDVLLVKKGTLHPFGVRKRQVHQCGFAHVQLRVFVVIKRQSTSIAGHHDWRIFVMSHSNCCISTDDKALFKAISPADHGDLRWIRYSAARQADVQAQQASVSWRSPPIVPDCSLTTN